MIFIDTNVVIDAIRSKNAQTIANHFKNVAFTDIKVSSVVVAELEYGAQHSSDYEKRRTQYKNFIQDFEIVPFTENDAEVYGKIRQQLALEGKLIGSNDMLIAAVALAHNATIVTHNVHEFSRVKGLNVEDWTI